MNTLKAIWKFLDGKKRNIALIVGCVLAWCIGRGWIAADTAAMVNTILAAIGLGHKAQKVVKANGVQG